MRRQARDGQMAEVHRDLEPVLETDKTTGLGATGLADLVGHRFADITAGGRAREMPGNVGCEPARAVGCVSLVNSRFKGHADMWEAPCVTLHHCRGCSSTFDPTRVLVPANDTVRAVGVGN